MGAREYGFLLFLTLLNVMNFVDRQLLASFANFIVPELELTNAQFGWLTGFAFIVFYSVAGLFAGALADLVHRPRLVAGAVTLWSALTAASGAARSFATLLAPRMFIGVGESVLTPASMSMLADRFPAARMGFASGFYYMGVSIGVGASLLVGGYLEPLVGWRGCFYLLGMLGVVFAVAMLFVKETPRQHLTAAPPDAEGGGQRTSFRAIGATLWAALRASPALTATMAGGAAFHFILGAAAFDQLWYVQERGFDRTESRRLTGWIGMLSGMAGSLFGGIAGVAFQRRTGQGRPMFLVWVGVAFTPLGFVYRLADPDSIWFWIGIAGGFFQLGTFYGPTFSTVQELVPPRIRATVVALYILLLNFVGLGVGITGGGYLIDASSPSARRSPTRRRCWCSRPYPRRRSRASGWQGAALRGIDGGSTRSCRIRALPFHRSTLRESGDGPIARSGDLRDAAPERLWSVSGMPCHQSRTELRPRHRGWGSVDPEVPIHDARLPVVPQPAAAQVVVARPTKFIGERHAPEIQLASHSTHHLGGESLARDRVGMVRDGDELLDSRIRPSGRGHGPEPLLLRPCQELPRDCDLAGAAARWHASREPHASGRARVVRHEAASHEIGDAIVRTEEKGIGAAAGRSECRPVHTAPRGARPRRVGRRVRALRSPTARGQRDVRCRERRDDVRDGRGNPESPHGVVRTATEGRMRCPRYESRRTARVRRLELKRNTAPRFSGAASKPFRSDLRENARAHRP